MPRTLLLGLAASLLLSPAALAQPNPDLAPSAGMVSLRSGFSPDPHAVDLMIGMGEDATSVSDDCAGSVGAAPSVVVDYDAGDAFLYAYIRSSSDTVLLVRTPDGEWYCNDDDEGLNAGYLFDNPQSGRYAFWVGAFSADMEEAPPATLYLTESVDEAPMLDGSGTPTSGSASLAGGFTPDPSTHTVMAGGPVSMTDEEGCVGFVDPSAPSFVLDYDGDGAFPLYVYAQPEGDDDLTLIVMDPDEALYCNDDADGLAPGLVIDAPVPGRYAVWVGTFSSRARTENAIGASLFFSETDGPTGGGFMDDMDMMDMDDGEYEGGEDISLFAQPAHGTISLNPGFGSRDTEVEAGGGDAVSVDGFGCAGFIDNGAPDLNVLYTERPDGEGTLAFSVDASGDTTLLINLPDGSWRCSDDEIGRNPAIVVDGPAGGLYNVWVGLYSQDDGDNAATLRVGESDPR